MLLYAAIGTLIISAIGLVVLFVSYFAEKKKTRNRKDFKGG